MADKRFIVTFPSTHAALQAERAALKAGIEVRMIPVPREISADCNMGIETSMEQENALMKIFAAGDIECNFVTLKKPRKNKPYSRL